MPRPSSASTRRSRTGASRRRRSRSSSTITTKSSTSTPRSSRTTATPPLAACGALAALFFGLGTLNIHTQIGLVTLVGLIAKHGILIVALANAEQRERGLDRTEAVRAAARSRLRPILMTTAAMIGGLVPLLVATGADTGSQRVIATVLVAGLLVGTLFTLFVLPAVYARFGRRIGGAVNGSEHPTAGALQAAAE